MARNPSKDTAVRFEFDLPEALDNAVSFVGKELALNSLANYVFAVFIAVVGVGLIWMIKGFIARRTEKWFAAMSKQRADQETALEVGRTLVPLLYLFPLYFALVTLRFSPAVHNALSFFLLIVFTARTVSFLSALASLVTETYLRRHSESINSAVGKALTPIIKVLFWTVGITVILDNMGFQISSLLAGLGIMGVAVGLAGQTILADFFGYLVILMDRPFSIGDYISLNNGSEGTVESIGLKTTRLRARTGEILVCPNGDITKQNITNSRLMYRRSRRFSFGVAYETPPAKVREIPQMVRDIVDSIDSMEVTRVFLTEFGDSSLNFEVVFSVDGRILDDALATQQELFVRLMEKFAEENIIFAYPTRTLYFANGIPQS